MQGGIGFTAAEDKLGNEHNFSALLSGARHFNIGRGELSLGGRAGWMQKNFENNWIASDGVAGDNSIPAGMPPFSYLDFGAGAFYLDVKENHVGLSINHAYNTGSNHANQYFKNVPHYYLTAGTRISMPGARDIALKPSLLAKSDGKAIIVDLNALVYYQDRIWAGASWRMTDAMVLLAGIKRNGLMIGYSYDITTSELRNHSSNTHELIISYCHPVIGKKRYPSHVNPRKMELGSNSTKECDCIYGRCYLMQALQGE